MSSRAGTAGRSNSPSTARSVVARRRLSVAAVIVGTLVLGWSGAGLACRHLADRAVEQGRLTRAERRFQWCHRLRPWDTTLRALAAQCARRRQDHDTWSTLVQAWAAESPAARGLAAEQELMWVQIGILEPDTQAQLNRLMAAGAESNDVAQAFTCGFLAQQDLPQAERILGAWDSGGNRADANYFRAVAARMKGDLNESRALLESVVTICPLHELAHAALGELLLDARLPNEALRHYLVILHDAPTSLIARTGAARCLRHLARWDAANAVLERVPTAATAWEERGHVALERGEYQVAVSLFIQTPETVENHHDGRIAFATAQALTGNRVETQRLLQRDARLESLRKQLRDLQVRVLLDSKDFNALRQLKQVKSEILRERG